jgi:hypothetical protein
MMERLRPIYGRVMEARCELCLDMESYEQKDMVFELYRRMNSSPMHFRHISPVISLT